MAGEIGGGLAGQVFALAKDLAKVEKDVETLGESKGDVRTALAQLGNVQDALEHLEERTGGLQEQVQALAPLRSGLDALAKTVKQIGEDLKALAAEPAEEKLAVWNWSVDRGMDREQAGEAWDVLINWVRYELQYGYGWVGWKSSPYAGNTGNMPNSGGPQVAARIPPCWYRHREAVRELSWLCQEWIKIHHTSYGTPNRAGDWHDRYAPGVKRRVITALEACVKANKHQDDPWETNWKLPTAPLAIDDEEAMSTVLSADLASRREPPAPGPVAAS
jgi:prefoldin subunit 5